MSIFSPLFSVRSKSSKNTKRTFSRSRSLRLESLEDRALLSVTAPAGELAALQTFYPNINWADVDANSYAYKRIDLADTVNTDPAFYTDPAAYLKDLIEGTTSARDLIVFNTAGLDSTYVLQLEDYITFGSGHNANSAILVSLNIAPGDVGHTYSPFTMKAASGLQAGSGQRIGMFSGTHYVAFGGINFQGTGTVAANGGAFQQNASSSVVTFDHVSFTGFSVGTNQGGAFFSGNGTSEFSNSLFVGNSASAGGAVFTTGNATSTINFSTFSANSATGAGGGANLGNDTTVRNSIFYGNTGSSASADLYLGTGSDQSNLYVRYGENVNDIAYSVSPFLGSGDTPYQLSPTSLAIGAAGSTNVAIDLAGNARVQRGTADLGAFESSYTDGRYNTYIGANGEYWDEAANWDRGHVPTAEETAYIQTGSTVVVTTLTQIEVDAFQLDDPFGYPSKKYVGNVLNNGTITTEILELYNGIDFTDTIINNGTILVGAGTYMTFQGDYLQKGDLQVYGCVEFLGEANFDAANITAYPDSAFSARDGGVVNVSADSTFTADVVEIYAVNGSTLNLEGLRTLTGGGTCDGIFAGEDSTILLPNLTTVTIGAGESFDIGAYDGGVVDISDKLMTIGGGGDLILSASEDSVINIPNLYFRKDITLTVYDDGASEINIPDLDTTHVVTVGDDETYGETYGNLSLREAVALAAADGKAITFAYYYGTSSAIFGDTIALTEGEILIDRDITILGGLEQGIMIDAEGNSRIFNVGAGATLSISDLMLTGGYVEDLGGAILSYGSLTLENVEFFGNYASLGGGAIMQYNKVLDMTNVDFTANISTYGGAVYVSRGQLYFSGGSVTNNSASARGAGIYLDIANANITNVDFADNNACDRGAAIYQKQGKLAVTGGSFMGNLAANGTIFAINTAVAAQGDEPGTLINGATFSNNTTECSGAAICISEGYMKVVDSQFDNNVAEWYGGGAIYSAADLTVENSSFTDNDAMTFGGGAIIHYDKTLTMTGVDFTGNTSDHGGAVYVIGGLLDVKGGSFTDNNVVGYGGAIHSENAETRITGVDFTGNSSKHGGAIYVIGGLLDVKGGSFTGNNVVGYGGAIHSENAETEITGVEFIDNSAVRGAAIYQNKGMMTITGGSFEDNNADNGAIYAINTAVAANDDEPGTLIDGVTFSNNTSKFAGAAICFIDGYMKIVDSQFDNNTAQSYGGGAIYSTADLTVEDSSFTDNNAINFGGGAIIHYNKTLTMTGVDFTGNTTNYGGALYVIGGLLDAEGGSFIDNNVMGYGGAINLEGAEAKITGVEFIDNSAVRGAAIYQNKGKMTITGGSFENHYANNGTIYATNTAVVANDDEPGTLIDGVTFSNNTSKYAGAAVCIIDGYMKVVDSQFDNNVAESYGGGAIYSTADLTVEGGSFTANNATNSSGGAIIHYNKTLTITDVDFIGNTADESGGAIYQGSGFVKIIDAIFEENESLANDPNPNDPLLSISGGGAIFLHSGDLEVTDSGFTGNKADNASATGIFKGAGGKLTVTRLGTNIGYSLGNLDFLDDDDLNW